ncbi:MAG: phosphatase PAP2 family protein [Acidobacteriota bacterium]
MRNAFALAAVTFIALAVAGPALAQDQPPTAASAPDGTLAEAPGRPVSALTAPFRRLTVTLIRGVRQVPSPDHAPVLINGGLLALAALPFDEVATLGASSSPLLKSAFAGWGKALGREWVQGGGALAAYVAGRIWDQPAVTAAAGDLIEAQVLSLTLTQAAKFAVGRTRPDGEARSFPSGHASAAFATARVIEHHVGRRGAIPAYAVAVYTSASRLQANSHFASDVVAGAALGLVVGRIAVVDVGRARLTVTPVPVSRGVGLHVVVAPARP